MYMYDCLLRPGAGLACPYLIKEIDMNKFLLAATLTFAGASTAHAADSLPLNQFGSVLSEDMKWQTFPAFPPEARLSVVAGNPAEAAPYVVRVKLPAGVKLMPHTHPEDRIYTVISGVFYIGIGTTFDPAKLLAYPPGAVVILPKNTPHFHWARAGDYMTQVSGIGPLGIKYIHDEDDPRNH